MGSSTLSDHGSVTIRGKHAKQLMDTVKPGGKVKLTVSGTVDNMAARRALPVGPGEASDDMDHDISMTIENIHGADPYDEPETPAKKQTDGAEENE